MREDLLKKALNKNISDCINAIFTEDNMNSFIKMFKHLYFFDYKNLLLIWRQSPNAKIVIGTNAIKHLDITTPCKLPSIALLYPILNIQKGEMEDIKYSSDYKIVYALDASDVPDITKLSLNNVNIMSRIKQILGCIINETSINIPGANLGFYDDKKNEILIRKNLSDTMLNKTLISVYIDVFLGSDNCEFLLIKKAFVKHMVYTFFDVLTSEDNIKIPCSIYYPKEIKAKEDMVREMCKDSLEIIMDLTRPVLTFNQTAIANNLLTSDYYPIVSKNLLEASNNLEDSYLSEQIQDFLNLLSLTDDECLKDLFEMVKNKSLFSYPPYQLTFKTANKEEVYYDRNTK